LAAICVCVTLSGCRFDAFVFFSFYLFMMNEVCRRDFYFTHSTRVFVSALNPAEVLRIALFAFFVVLGIVEFHFRVGTLCGARTA